MADDVYLYGKKRPTNELEHDQAASPGTKKVSMYGWDGANKVRLKVNTSGSLLSNELAAITNQAITLCSADATNTPSSAATTSTNTWMGIQNAGAKIVYMGGAGVTTATGNKVFPNQNWVFERCQSTFKVYFIPAVGDTTEIRTVER